MLKSVVVVVALVSVVWGAPQSDSLDLDVDTRIVGGEATSIENHPYMVSVQRNDRHHCGGSIIASTWVVSAAHCFLREVEAYSIRAGSSWRNEGGQVIPARKIILHELYLRQTLDYDIALVQLVKPITIRGARAITLPPPDNNPPIPGSMGVVTGWGLLWSGGPLADRLKIVSVPVVTMEICRSRYGQTVITERKFCAGYWLVGGKDSCTSDSGGPLVIDGVLTGIVSWGPATCALPDGPGVYASVPSLRNWIKRNSGI
ncbi:trypsin-like [Anoplophora glabripennis]|uniref:trypsin-like n=1 Tax=Anoplophora glabripennis TaxID=217634 RepID=UPI000875612E|nr:trypsin-like [Anoplophora glabripennis]